MKFLTNYVLAAACMLFCMVQAHAQKLEEISSRAGAPDFAMQQLWKNDTLWVTGTTGLYRYNKQGIWKSFRAPATFSMGQYMSVAVNPYTGRKFVGIASNGDFAFSPSLLSFADENNTWTVENTPGYPLENCQHINFDKDSTLWASFYGVNNLLSYRRPNNVWTGVPPINIRTDQPYCVAVDRLNHKWIGAANGVGRINTTGSPALRIRGPVMPNDGNNLVSSYWQTSHKPDSIYFCSFAGLMKANILEDTIIVFRRPSDWGITSTAPNANQVFSYTADSIGAYFLGATGGLLLCERGNVKKALPIVTTGLNNAELNNITVDKFNNKWIGVRGLYRLKDVKAEFNVTGDVCTFIPQNQSTALWDNLSRFEWDFGDGQTGIGTNPRHGYVRSGNYTIRLIAINADSIRDTVSHTFSTGTLNNFIAEGDSATFYENEGILHGLVSSGTLPSISLTWQFRNNASSPWITLGNGLSLGPVSFEGQYRFIATGSCLSDTSYTRVGILRRPVVSMVPLLKICRGDSVFNPLSYSGVYARELVFRFTRNGQPYAGFDSTGVMLRENGNYILYWQYRSLPEVAFPFNVQYLALDTFAVNARLNTFCSVTDTMTLTLGSASTANYRIRWMRNDTLLPDTGARYVSSVPGQYRVIYQSRLNGCKDSAAFPLNANSFRLATIVSSNNGLCPADSVLLTMVPLDGPLPAGYTWHWEMDGAPIPNSNQRESIWAREAGTYRLIYNSPEGCSGDKQKTLDFFSFGTYRFVGQNGGFCPGDSFSTRIIGPGLSGEQIIYKLFRGRQFIDSNLTGIFNIRQAGVYRIQYKGELSNCASYAHSDANAALDSFTVSGFTTPSINVSGIPAKALCPGESATLSLGADALSRQWYKNDTLIAGQTGMNLVVTEAGTYTARLLGIGGCPAVTGAVVITKSILPPAATISGTATFCSHDSSIIAANTSTTLPLQWTLNGRDIQGANSAGYVAKESGVYVLNILTDCGPLASNALNITRFSRPQGSITIVSGQTCASDSVTLLAPASEWQQWSNGETTPELKTNKAGRYSVKLSSFTGCDTVMFYDLILPVTPVLSLNYDTAAFCSDESIRVWAPAGFKAYIWSTGETSESVTTNLRSNLSLSVIDARNCVFTKTLDMRRLTDADTLHAVNPLGCYGDTAVLAVPSAPAGATYSWNNGQTGPTLIVTDAGLYKLRLSYGTCISLLEYYIYFNCVEKGPEPEYPNVISPNGDKLNDTYEIKNLGAKTNITFINRWGETVYHHADYANEWAAQGLPAGVYYVTAHSPGHTDYSGWVHVVR
ncbi:MAG: gliding motility-associated C-terminal domain-containing protein [Bacteroidota bacterium]